MKNINLKLKIFWSPWTQKEIALKTKIKEPTLTRIILGEREATPKEKEDLAHALSCDITDIFVEVECHKKSTTDAR